MNQSAVTVRPEEPELTPFQVIERVITTGDLSKMSPQDRIAFYWRTCESTGLNPLTRPFEFINLSGKLTMYAKRDATDQLRRIHRVSIDGLDQIIFDDILTVTAKGHTPDGRTDQDVGSVNLKGLSGDARANATKKAITQAKRRLTLSLVGLGFLDESEIEGATADVDPTTGELVERPKAPTLIEAVNRQRAAMAADSEPAEEAPTEPLWAAAPDETPENASEPVTTPDVGSLIDRLRNAQASSLVGLVTEPQKAKLGAVIGRPSGLDWAGEVLPVLVEAFGEGFVADEMTAAQAQSVIGLAESDGQEAFVAAWRASVPVNA